MLMVALLSLTKTPLFICLRRKSCSTLRGFGWSPLILKSYAHNQPYLFTSMHFIL